MKISVLNERILPPPDPAKLVVTARPDGWPVLKPVKPDETLIAAAEEARKKKEDKANSSLRREPELPDHVEIVHEKTEPAPENEFRIILDDDQEDNARQRQAIRRQMGGIARQASLNPMTVSNCKEYGHARSSQRLPSSCPDR